MGTVHTCNLTAADKIKSFLQQERVKHRSLTRKILNYRQNWARDLERMNNIIEYDQKN